MGNFQGTYKRRARTAVKNFQETSRADLKNCRQKARETLRGYIRCFFRQCNELPNVANVDVIGAFLSGMTYESLVHKLGRKGP